MRTPSASRAARCSAACGIHGSSAATTKSTAGTGPTPASIVEMNRSWPGTSTKATSPTSASEVQQYPSSMDRPRRCSSLEAVGVTAGECPTRVDLPWSTCPAVATTCTASRLARAGAQLPRVARRPAARPRSGRAAATPARPGRRPTALPAASRAASPGGSATAALSSRLPVRHRHPPSRSIGRRERSRDAVPTDTDRAMSSARRYRASGSLAKASCTGLAGPVSVASSAARVSLSTRMARAIG